MQRLSMIKKEETAYTEFPFRVHYEAGHIQFHYRLIGGLCEWDKSVQIENPHESNSGHAMRPVTFAASLPRQEMF